VSTLTGTWALTRFAARRDRVRIAVWIVSIVVLVVITAGSVKGLYPTQHDLDVAAAASIDNPAALAFNGPAYALDTIGGQVAFQVGAFGLTVVALMSLLMVGRLTRAEEESGRLELVSSMAVGRHAALAAALVVVSVMDVVVGALVGVSLIVLGLPVAGSVLFGFSFTMIGLLFIGVEAVTTQVTESSRTASGLAGAVLGASYAVRAIGDVGNGTLSWFSPIGLVQKARPYAGDVWWPLGLALLLTVGLALVAAYLLSHRDFGSGLVPPRAGPARANPALGHPVGLAVRLQRGSVLWWAFAVLLTGVAYGSIANSIDEFVGDNQAIADMVAAAGGGASLVDSYLATSLLILAIIAGGAAVQMTLRLRSEETGGRVEPLLATPLSRTGWMSSHLGVALGGSALIMAAGGFGTGTTYALVIGDASQIPRLVGAALVHVPAVWILVGIACALFGVVPRWTVLAWVGVAVGLVIAMFGTLLDLPGLVIDLSPFQHTPQAPAQGLEALPLVVLLAVGAALTAVGLAAFRRRDLG
jgi:ABC-2 type transport system permease protein